MRFKKIFSLAIISGLFFNNFEHLAFANNYIKNNERYETYEGSNIAVHDTLDEQDIDISVEGETLVNIYDANNITKVSGVTISNGIVTVKNVNSIKYVNMFNSIKPKLLKPDTEYTLIVNVHKNTLPKIDADSTDGASNGLVISSSTSGKDIDVFYSENPSTVSRAFEIEGGKTGIFKTILRTRSDISNPNYFLRTFICDRSLSSSSEVSFSIILIEGNHLDKDIEFFEGMKSVGELENNTLHTETIGENIFDVEYFKDCIETNYDSTNYGYEIKDGKNTVWTVNNHDRLLNKNLLSNNYKFKENTQYVIKSEVFLDPNNSSLNNTLRGDVIYTDGTTKVVFHAKSGTNGSWNRQNVTTDKNKTVEKIVFSYGAKSSKGWINLDSLYIGEYIEGKNDFNYSYNINTNKITLSEPLRSIPRGIPDRIIKKDDKWYIERNCEEITLDDSSNWSLRAAPSTTSNKYVYDVSLNIPSTNINDTDIKAISDTFFYDNNASNTSEWSIKISGSGQELIFRTDINMDNVTKLKEYLKTNPFTVVYQRKTPAYELIDSFSEPNLYTGSTHVLAHSIIPANIKLTVDRAANFAKKYIELAKNEPTLENISQARYWSNLLRESTLKDSFQEEIDSINNIADLSIEPKSLSTNTDVYITMKNNLSLSLDTNNILFEEISTTENTEKQNAVKLTVTSSLPYKVNAYLSSPISNTDKSKTLDASVIGIKSSLSNTYQSFTGLDKPISIFDNQSSGVDNTHNVDIRLSATSSYKADIYKTSIKLEVEQK